MFNTINCGNRSKTVHIKKKDEYSWKHNVTSKRDRTDFFDMMIISYGGVHSYFTFASDP